MFRLVQTFRRRWIAVAAMAALSLAACDNDLPRMAPSASLYGDADTVIGIATAPLPQAHAYRDGQEALLDLAINDIASADLARHLATLDLSEFHQLPGQIAAKLEARGLRVRVLQQEMNPNDYPERSSGQGDKFADHDYSALRASAGVDRLLLLQVRKAGTMRNYYSLFPVSGARGYARVSGQMIDLRDSSVQWSGLAERTREPKPGATTAEQELSDLDVAVLAALHSASAELSDDLAF